MTRNHRSRRVRHVDGAWLSLVERKVWDLDVAGSNPAAPTILDSVPFRPKFSKGRSIPPASAAGDSPYCSPDAATTFPRRTDRGRRNFQARRDERGRRDFCGWGPTGCESARRQGWAGFPAGSGGRRVRQGRRAERRFRPSDPTVPKGGASLRASLAAVGSVKPAPLPALGVRSSHAGGSGSALPRLETRFPDYIAGATPQSFRESGDHFHRDIVFPALDEADIVAVAVDFLGQLFL